MRMVYMTAKDEEQARLIGRSLVEGRLAACVNILGRIESIFWWEGKVQADGEVALIAKTREELVDRLIARVKEVHSYQCPCIIAIPIVAGSTDYLNWLAQETTTPAD